MSKKGQLEKDCEVILNGEKIVDSWEEYKTGCRVLVENKVTKFHIELRS